MIADTSSAAAGITAVVIGIAVVWAWSSVKPMAARSAAAVDIASGVAITYDINEASPESVGGVTVVDH